MSYTRECSNGMVAVYSMKKSYSFLLSAGEIWSLKLLGSFCYSFSKKRVIFVGMKI